VRISFAWRRNIRAKFFKHPATHLLARGEIECDAAISNFTEDFMSDSQKTIAIVDDDPEMRSSLATLLGAVGYRAETYDSAETFLICASSCKACCLVIDINLGDITGVELAYQLSADGLKWPIIFMSGHDDAAIKNQASAVGPVAFLHKPFRGNDLIDAIKKAIQ
jgi:FixJ family two-component response regulator